jgi:RNA polymerase II subunit A C-terminal domain phosphatase
MLLRLPSSLHYPIKITKIEKRVGEYVNLDDHIFVYSYKTKRKEGSRYDEEEHWVEREYTTHFSSTLEGTIKSWRVWDGDVISNSRDICEIEEDCAHEVQFNGLCTNCGKDLTRELPDAASDMDRAPIRMAHDTPHLTISQDEAARIDQESKQRLLAGRKLSLVVDLDQTIIHAAVDPTIGEWQKDPHNPNYDAVKDVRAFQLLDDGPGMRGCWYYIKMRPGLTEFLDNISQLYELHIYTMGTRQYAQQISNIVDPDHTFFGDRILSRDESGSMVAKNLERLFPIDTKMVVIIDDRGDVWKWSANLVRVIPFDFFVGIGDINSSFLPKKTEIAVTPKQEKKTTPQRVSDDDGDGEVAADGTSTLQNGTSALENLLAMSGSNDAAAREEQTKSQEETIHTQLEEKPLQKMQRQQDEKDAAESGSEAASPSETTITSNNPDSSPHTNGTSTAATSVPSSTTSQSQKLDTQTTDSDSDSSDNDSSSGTPKKNRHSILKNDDEELIHLERSLTAVHTAFFKEWDRKRIANKGGRVAALSGQRKASIPSESAENDDGPANLSLVPDVKRVMPAMKMRVLGGVVIVFSGVLPLGTDIQSADISIWAKTFGAEVREEVGAGVTHVVAARSGTAKVKRAVKRGIKVVSTGWLFESLQKWRKVSEGPFLLEGAGGVDGSQGSPGRSSGELGNDSLQGLGTDLLLSDSEDTDLSGTDTEGADGRAPKRLRLATNIDGADSLEDDEYTPPTLDQEEYDKIQEELREFMGSDMDSDSDAESVRSELSVRAKKRRRDDMEDEPEDGRPSGSRLKHMMPAPKSKSQTTSPGGAQAEANDEGIDDEQIEREQAQAEANDRHQQEVESDSDDEDQRELEEMLGGGSDDDDEIEHMNEATDLKETWSI